MRQDQELKRFNKEMGFDDIKEFKDLVIIISDKFVIFFSIRKYELIYTEETKQITSM